MDTAKLYKNDTYIKEWTGAVTSVKPLKEDDSRLLITLDRTAFFPEGGGQSCDTGFIGPYRVTDVQEEKGEVYHTIEKGDEPVPRPGASFHCSLDWERRFDNMQRHCGEHILSGIFYSLCGGINRGFHMGGDYMTIDISLEEDPAVTEITRETALEAELAANRVIWSDAPVTVTHFDSREEAEKMPLRKALALEEDITIVSVGSRENAADCVACCGTHPSSAGQVGLIKIYKVERYKGMFRIYFEAGERALKDYDEKHELISSLSQRYSASAGNLASKLDAREKKLSDLKDELYHIKKAFTAGECSRIDSLIEDSDLSVLFYSSDCLSAEALGDMSKHYMGKAPLLIILFSEKDKACILASDGVFCDCGSLVKEYAPKWSGKGGGSRVSARAVFPSEEKALAFSEALKELLS